MSGIVARHPKLSVLGTNGGVMLPEPIPQRKARTSLTELYDSYRNKVKESKYIGPFENVFARKLILFIAAGVVIGVTYASIFPN